MPAGRSLIPFYALRVRDLIRPLADVEVTCQACRHSARIEVIALLASAGPEINVRQLEKRLRCESCQMRGWVTIGLHWR